jgi:transcriptional regulator with XRE-family HTH domain
MAKVDTYRHPELGQALRFVRARSGLSQARVAREVSARGGRLTPVWLSRVESAADRGGGPYPSLVLLDRILAVLGSSRAELERLLAERPWARVREGAEWEEARAGAPSPAAAAHERASAPAQASPPDIVAEAAELGARYARLPRDAQLALLARVRELS